MDSPRLTASLPQDGILTYARPLIPLLLSLIFGISLGARFPGYRIWAHMVVVFGLFFILYRIKQHHRASLFPLMLFVGLGYLSLQPWTAPWFSPRHITHFLGNHPWQIVGRVDEKPLRTGNRLKFVLNIESIKGQNEKDSRPFPVVGKIRVTLRDRRMDVAAGDRISVVGKIRAIRNFNNPGGFNYKRYMTFKGIWGTTYVPEGRLKKKEASEEISIGRAIENWRKHISARIEQSSFVRRKEGTKGVLKALLLGDRTDIPQGLREAFHRAGVGHLLAISGLHVGIVASAAFFLFVGILSRVKLLLWQAWTRKGAAILSLFPVLAYGFLSGMSPSTQRAVIMVVLFFITFLFEREIDLINTLALAAMMILIIHPPSLFSISFQLSFSAVLSIIYGLSQTKDVWSRNKNRGLTRRVSIQNKLLSFILASLFAIVGTLPLGMYYFNQVSIVGILANLLVIPLVGFFVIPSGLVSVFLYPFSVTAASIFLNISAAVLSVALHLITFFSELPFAFVKTITPSYLEIGCFYLIFWAILNLKGAGAPVIFKPQKRLLSRRYWAKAVLVTVILVSGADIFYWLSVRFWHDDLRVTVMDVGQGGAVLLELPKGVNLLVDGGGFADPSSFDVGAHIIAPLLWRKKIKTIDTLVLSHPNSDHLNGLLYIAEHFHVKNVWSNNEPSPGLGYQKFGEIIREKEIHHPRFEMVLQKQVINGVEINILYPPPDFLSRKKTDKWRNYNNNSLVLKVRFGSQVFLFPGDIMKRAEKELVNIWKDKLKSTVLVAPHHGSRTSSTDRFLDKVQPAVVVVSSGWKNSARFPDPLILNRYKKRRYRVFRTDTDGALTLSTDGLSLRIKRTVAASN